jgi:hypothetical protein
LDDVFVCKRSLEPAEKTPLQMTNFVICNGVFDARGRAPGAAGPIKSAIFGPAMHSLAAEMLYARRESHSEIQCRPYSSYVTSA